MKPSKLIIGKTEIKPGQRLQIDLPLPPLYTHTQVAMPVVVIRGKKPGPRLFISAALHGDEINGVEIIRRILKLSDLNRIHGDLIAVPVVNLYGLLNQSRYLPDRRDINRSFPGSTKGSFTSRIAHTFMKDIVKQCTHGIDLHTGALHRSNLPQIRACLEDSKTKRLALAFGTPVVLNSNLRDGSLRQAAKDHGLPMLLYEGGEALRFNEVSIRAGVQGILNVMQVLNMLTLKTKKTKKVEPKIAKDSLWVRAATSGILRSRVGLGDWVKKDQILGLIGNPFGQEESNVLAPHSGLIIGKTNLPLTHEGEALYHLARFKNPTRAKHAVKNFHGQLNPKMTSGPSGEPALR